jgi:hypothetical protein
MTGNSPWERRQALRLPTTSAAARSCIETQCRGRPKKTGGSSREPPPAGKGRFAYFRFDIAVRSKLSLPITVLLHQLEGALATPPGSLVRRKH